MKEIVSRPNGESYKIDTEDYMYSEIDLKNCETAYEVGNRIHVCTWNEERIYKLCGSCYMREI